MQLLKAEIKFPRTKDKPLIPLQCFSLNSDFKSVCRKFVETFADGNSAPWKCDNTRLKKSVENGKSVYKYVQNKSRAQRINDDFLRCVEEIQAKLEREKKVATSAVQAWENVLEEYKPQEYPTNVLKKQEVSEIFLTAECVIRVDIDEHAFPPLQKVKIGAS